MTAEKLPARLAVWRTIWEIRVAMTGSVQLPNSARHSCRYPAGKSLQSHRKLQYTQAWIAFISFDLLGWWMVASDEHLRSRWTPSSWCCASMHRRCLVRSGASPVNGPRRAIQRTLCDQWVQGEKVKTQQPILPFRASCFFSNGVYVFRHFYDGGRC